MVENTLNEKIILKSLPLTKMTDHFQFFSNDGHFCETYKLSVLDAKFSGNFRAENLPWQEFFQQQNLLVHQLVPTLSFCIRFCMVSCYPAYNQLSYIRMYRLILRNLHVNMNTNHFLVEQYRKSYSEEPDSNQYNMNKGADSNIQMANN